MPALTAESLGIPALAGAVAVDAPIAPLVLPDNVHLNGDGYARIHHDSYNSDVYDRPGPRGDGTTVRSVEFAAATDLVFVCPTMMFDANGQLLATCVQASTSPPSRSTHLLLLDPVSLAVEADVQVAVGPLGGGAAGGAYLTYARDGRIVIGSLADHVEEWKVEVNGGVPSFVRLTSYDVSALAGSGGLLEDTFLDFAGRLWFAFTTGRVGYVERATGTAHSIDLGETLTNSTGFDASGVNPLGVTKLYKVSVAGDGGVQLDWARPYDAGSVQLGVVPDASVKSAQLSTANGLIYGYGAALGVTTNDAYYLAAADWATGAEVFRVYAGNDLAFNASLGRPFLGPDGAAYMGSFHGITRFTDAP